MNGHRPKRVVLHVRDDDLEDANPHEAIRQCFDKINRLYQELEDGCHYVWIYRTEPHMPESTTYIMIDMEKDKFSGHMDLDNFPHEMYNIVCIEHLMIFMTINGISGMGNVRFQHTDQYPWAGREDGDVTPGEPELPNGVNGVNGAFHE